ncbi:hypothetical protein BH09MYX1_BH09MYX1_51950 [soil metagenome]
MVHRSPCDPFGVGDGGKLPTVSGGDGGTQTPEDLQKCATASAKPEALPVKLVVMYDKSGSMQESSTFEPGKVNIVFTPTNSIPQTLSYNPDCTNGTGWRYDDPKAPKKILLCGGTCDKVQTDKSGTVDVVLGCETKGPAVN